MGHHHHHPAISATRCGECHASIPPPVELDAVVMQCSYCGHHQPVPDLEVRRKLLLEQQREARLLEERHAQAAREAATAHERAADRKEARSGRRRSWVLSLLGMLVAPVIIGITVFDLPARLGFGASGSDRLELLQSQFTGRGCKVVSPIASQYASSSVSELVKVDHGCVRVVAAGGSGHRSLSLRLFASDGKQVATSDDTTDPQLTYCTAHPDTLRYEIKLAVASKGRLSHMVLSCSEAPTTEPVTGHDAKLKPGKRASGMKARER